MSNLNKIKSYTSLNHFLRCNKTIQKDFTHTSIPGKNVYPGSYCIKEEDRDIFYKLYNEHIFKNNNQAHLTEKHKDVSPILIDLDFRHKPTNETRKYKKPDIRLKRN